MNPTARPAPAPAGQPGSQEKVEAAVAAHQQEMLRHAWRMLRDFDAAQDVVQEAFIRYMREPPAERDPRGVAAWLRRVTRNLCIDLIRRETRMRTRHERLESPLSAPAAGPRLLAAEDARRLAEELLAGLTESQRRIVLLRLRDGKSYREIAEATGMSVSNVGFHLCQALKRLSERAKSRGAEARP